MDVIIGAMGSIAARLWQGVVALFRGMWPDDGLHQPVEPWRAVAAIVILAVAAPFLYVTISAARLTGLMWGDDMFMFLALFLVPMFLFVAAVSGAAFAAGVAVAIGVAAGTRKSSIWAWGYLSAGVAGSVMFLQVGANRLAAFTAAAVAVGATALVMLDRPSWFSSATSARAGDRGRARR